MSKDFYEIKRIFLEIYDEHFDKIFNFFYRSLLHKESAEDLTGNTFLKAFDALKKNKVNIDNLIAWLYRVASNELISYYRYNKIRKNQIEYNCNHNHLDNDENPVINYLKFMDIKTKLKKLKSEERIIIDMHFFQNMNYKEMSNILNIKEETLRSKVHRILKKLKKFLN